MMIMYAMSSSNKTLLKMNSYDKLHIVKSSRFFYSTLYSKTQILCKPRERKICKETQPQLFSSCVYTHCK